MTGGRPAEAGETNAMMPAAPQPVPAVEPDAAGEDATPPVPLAYARLLYAGGGRYRSGVGVALLLVSVAVAVGCGAVVADLHADLPAGGRMAFATGGFVAAAVATFLLAAVVSDRQEGFEITTAGVRTGGGLTPWPRVTRFVAGGTPAGPHVRLFFTRRNDPAGTGGVSTVQLPGTRRTAVADYETLVAVLRREVLPAYPHLDLGGYELPRAVAATSSARLADSTGDGRA